jgi:hypothetical protein
MLFRLVRPMKRSGSAIPQFVQRIPADLRGRVAGLKLAIPPGDDNFHHVVISDNARDLRFSLQPRDFATAKIRQAVALAGKLYRAWVSSEGKERTTAVILTPRGFVMDRSGLDGDEDEALFLSVSERLQATQNSGDAADLEPILGLIVNRLLLAQGIAEVDAPSRAMLLAAFADALRCFLDPSPQCRWRLRLRSQIRTAPGGASSREQDRRPPALPTAKVSLSRTAQMPHRTTPCIGLVANTPVKPAARAPGRGERPTWLHLVVEVQFFPPGRLVKARGNRA